MTPSFRPLSETGGLPPRRIEARDSRPSALHAPIVTQRPADRALDYFEREQLPSGVRETMASAWSGDLSLQSLMFNAMLDTWPRLQSAINEITQRVWKSEWEVKPYARRGEEPDEKSQELAAFVESALWGMKPEMRKMECGLEQTIKAIVLGYYYAHYCGEIRWKKTPDGWFPAHTKTLPARFYAYTSSYGDFEDRLQLDPTGNSSVSSLIDFPEDRFLVGVNSGHSGHPITGAPLRSLTGYWLASTYGLKWFMQFTQLFGIPWRHAELADEGDRAKVESLLANIGASGYLVTKTGVKINVLDAARGANQLPQKDLIELADQQCDKFILGQTLTSGTDGGSGNRALGEVHEDTLLSNVEAIADFVGQVITHQFIPAIVRWNYGETRTDLPEFWVKRNKPKDEKSMAERDVALGLMDGKFPVSKAWLYERHGIPMPAEDDETFTASPDGAQGDPATRRTELPHETKAKVEGSDAPKPPQTVDKLADAVLENLTGVTREWLSPVRPVFERLAALAMSGNVNDKDFMTALEKAQREMPELFDRLNTGALETAFEEAIGTAMLAGSVKRYER
jgi:phage gp29-like protein